MIYTFQEQLIMIIYFVILGIFISIMFDTIQTLFNKIKIINYLLQFISWTIVNIICINAINKISNGYVPIYIFLFFLLGYIIYNKLFSESYIKIILKIKENRQNILLAIFPITLYNYIIRNISEKIKIISKKKQDTKNNTNKTSNNKNNKNKNKNKNRKKKNEKNNNINNDYIIDDNNAGLH